MPDPVAQKNARRPAKRHTIATITFGKVNGPTTVTCLCSWEWTGPQPEAESAYNRHVREAA